MTIVITMAGLGSRFRKAGYNVPKYMIEAKGKTLFEWSMLSLEGFKSKDNKYFFIVRKEDKAEIFIRDAVKKLGIQNVQIIELDELTDGQASTAMMASPYWNPNSELLIYNIDTYVVENMMTSCQIEGDGFIPCFQAEGEHWSFVNVDSNGDAVEVREKKRISNNCTLGLYYFKSCELFENLYGEYYSSSDRLEKGEKYIAPLYNYMIQKGMRVRITNVDYEKIHVLGTPEELDAFLALKEV